jgi:hypothetical protein
VKILYLGFSLPYNERTICNTIVRHLQNNYALSKFEVHYRPHPARQKRFKEEMITLKSPRGQTLVTVWEDQMQYQKNLPLINNEYLSFLLDFDIVIATPTTMALEVMMLGIPCIIDSGDDGIHITSPWYAMTHYLHLEDLFSIPELRIAKSELEICNHLDALIKSKKNLQKYSLQNIIEFQNPFSTNLVEFLKSICFKLSYKP